MLSNTFSSKFYTRLRYSYSTNFFGTIILSMLNFNENLLEVYSQLYFMRLFIHHDLSLLYFLSLSLSISHMKDSINYRILWYMPFRLMKIHLINECNNNLYPPYINDVFDVITILPFPKFSMHIESIISMFTITLSTTKLYSLINRITFLCWS